MGRIMQNSTPVNIAIAGLNFGRHIMRRDLLEGAGREWISVAGVTDLNPELRREVAALHGLREYESLEAVLAEPAIEAVGLFTPPAGRAKLIRACLLAGKSVMTTKPFELDPAAAAEVLSLARERHLTLHLNSPSPLPGADTAQLLAWQDELDLGRIVGLYTEVCADYHETADGSWYDDPVRCPAAPLFRIGIYGINELITLVGAVEAVAVRTSHLRTGRPTPDNGALMLAFENGTLGTVFCSMCIDDGRPHQNQLLVHFERGTAVRNFCAGPRPKERKGSELSLEFRAPDGSIQCRAASFSAGERAGAYQWENFHRAVRSGRPLPGERPDDEIVAGIRVIQAMRRAEETGRWYRLHELA